MSSDITWQTVGSALSAPLPPEAVDFRIQGGNPFEKDGKPYVRVIAYIDARAVMDRLDAVVGPGNWSFDWQPLITSAQAVTVVKGSLTVLGVPQSDVGAAGPTKAAVSDALKRAAVHFGVGRYLYDIEATWAQAKLDKAGKITGIVPSEITRLRSMLPKPPSAA